ncbi:hypothetical protein T265_02370 [Opisthorchis viverrini]|uniref:Uncharacterized protein n=1 Tax=Opisthorchis viverrini TaxID=6198 RepID=A0A075AIE0_OPIVI|nr:hypothetical protein T265_02370 [Opisthorchis viverrini]KER31469.1 hypothetical protein T265_02370 [Opisthorchis viverrini]
MKFYIQAYSHTTPLLPLRRENGRITISSDICLRDSTAENIFLPSASQKTTSKPLCSVISGFQLHSVLIIFVRTFGAIHKHEHNKQIR